jgi:hypothetical protein
MRYGSSVDVTLTGEICKLERKKHDVWISQSTFTLLLNALINVGVGDPVCESTYFRNQEH